MVTEKKQSSLPLGILYVFCLCQFSLFTNADDTFPSDNVDNYEKRGFDRYSFLGKLGKRQEDEVLTPEEQFETDDTNANEKREEGANDTPVVDDNLLNAKRKIDRLMFSGALGKKRSPYYRFAGTLGKREGGTDGSDNTESDSEKRALDRLSYFGTLGKRGSLDMRMFRGALGKRLDSMYYGRLGKRFSRYLGQLGKRSPLYRSYIGHLGKRKMYKAYFGNLGKRGRIDNMYFGHLGKRDVHSRTRRSTKYNWFMGRPVRAKPIYTQTRGIDRFFSTVGLGKRVPDERFLPTLGKRFFIPYEDNYYEDF